MQEFLHHLAAGTVAALHGGATGMRSARTFRVSIVAMLAVLIAIGVSAFSARPVASRSLGGTHNAPSSSPKLLYISAGHLWLKPVQGGSARLIRTPWPTTTKDENLLSQIRWAPDGQRVALDDSKGRLAVIHLGTGHITVLLGRHCSKNCSPAVFSWSPDGRYLALIQPTGRGERAVLRVWDSGVGTTRRLLGGVSAYVAYPAWSHDSTRVAVEVGAFNASKSVFPAAVSVDLTGHVVQLGKGEYLSWSPDDRWVGVIRPNFCGANTCDEDEIVRSSAGGAAVVLARHTTSLFDNPIWAPQARGYAFDRWLLNASGHPTRRLAGPLERVVSWRPDGSRLALQTYHPYQGTPDVLYTSTPDHNRVRLYGDGRNAGCGVCSKDVYSVAWGSSDLLAFSTPTYPNPKNVTIYSKFFVSSLTGGARSRIGIPSTDIVNILGFVRRDHSVIIHAGKAIYRYDVAAHRVTTIVTGVPAGYATAILDPRAGGGVP